MNTADTTTARKAAVPRWVPDANRGKWLYMQGDRELGGVKARPNGWRAWVGSGSNRITQSLILELEAAICYVEGHAHVYPYAARPSDTKPVAARPSAVELLRDLGGCSDTSRWDYMQDVRVMAACAAAILLLGGVGAVVLLILKHILRGG